MIGSLLYHCASSPDIQKQNSVSLSTAEAEYIAAGSCCAQLLWMTQTLKDYGIYVKHVPLLCDNESAIKIAHNPVQHSRTKHIEVRHHFIRDHVAKGDINLKHTTKKYTSVMIRVCHSRSCFLSCMYIHDDFMTESR